MNLIDGFELLSNSLQYCHLLGQQFHLSVGCFVDFVQVGVELAREEQAGVEGGAVFLEVCTAHSAALSVGWCIFFLWWEKAGVEDTVLALVVGASELFVQ